MGRVQMLSSGAVLVALWAAPAAAQSGTGWLSETGRTELASADLICVGEVAAIQRLRASAMIEIRLREVLSGPDPNVAVIRLLATDPRAYQVGQECLWLLKRRETPGMYRQRGRHMLGNPEGADRLSVMRELLRIEALTAPDARRTALRTMLMANLGGRPWVRWHAIRELFVLVEREPGFLGPKDVAELEQLLAQPLKKSFHQYLVTTICRAQVVPPLERMLAAAKPADRLAAAGALGALPAVRRTAYLLSRLPRERRAVRRARLCELLGSLAAADAVLAAKPGPPGPRTAAATAARQVTDVLRERLVDDEAPSVRAAVAQALAWCDPQCRPLLLQALADDPAPTTRAAVALLLGRLGERRALPVLRAELAGTPSLLVRVAFELAVARLTAKARE